MNKENINIALKTLKLLKKKPWGEIRLEEIIKNSKKHKQSIKTKNDLLKILPFINKNTKISIS